MESVLVALFNHSHNLSTLAFDIRPVLPVRALQIQGVLSLLRRGVDEILETDMESINTTERLAGLRELMKKNKVDIYSM